MQNSRDNPVDGGWYDIEAVIALYRLVPEGKALAEEWLTKTLESRASRPLKRRAMLAGVMGRPSFEADCMTMNAFEDMVDGFPDDAESGMWQRLGDLETWFEEIGRFGPAGRLALPRLVELRDTSPNPWTRCWAAEAVAKIAPSASK